MLAASGMVSVVELNVFRVRKVATPAERVTRLNTVSLNTNY